MIWRCFFFVLVGNGAGHGVGQSGGGGGQGGVGGVGGGVGGGGGGGGGGQLFSPRQQAKKKRKSRTAFTNHQVAS